MSEENDIRQKYPGVLGDFVSFGYPQFEVADGIWGRLIELNNGDFEFVITISDDLRAETLRNAWGKIDYYRQSIREAIGSKLLGSEKLLHGISSLHEHGWSYAEITRELNIDCMSFLCQYMDKEERSDDVTKGLGSIFFFRTLKAVRMKDQKILDTFFYGVMQMRDGKAPWNPYDMPIDRQKVRETIRQFNKELTTKKYVITEEQTPSGIEWMWSHWIYTINPIYLRSALNRVRKTFPDYARKYEQQHLDRNFRIIQAMG